MIDTFILQDAADSSSPVAASAVAPEDSAKLSNRTCEEIPSGLCFVLFVP